MSWITITSCLCSWQALREHDSLSRLQPTTFAFVVGAFCEHGRAGELVSFFEEQLTAVSDKSRGSSDWFPYGATRSCTYGMPFRSQLACNYRLTIAPRSLCLKVTLTTPPPVFNLHNTAVGRERLLHVRTSLLGGGSG